LSKAESLAATSNVVVNKDAILDTIKKWNEDNNSNSADTGKFVKITAGSDYASLLKDYTLPTATVTNNNSSSDTEVKAEETPLKAAAEEPTETSTTTTTEATTEATTADSNSTDGLHIWVKESTAKTVDSDGKTQLEHGNNLQFIGYYMKDGVAYEIKIDPNIQYKPITNTTSANTDATGTARSDFEDALDIDNSSIKISVYGATAVTVSDTNIRNYVEIEFTKDSNWIYKDGYFYYTKVLPSGGSTTPLIKAVRMKDNVGDEVINATYNLTINNDSTQVSDEAAAAVFLKTDGKTATFTMKDKEKFSDIVLGKATNIVYATSDTNACSYSLSESHPTVCSECASVSDFNTNNRGKKEHNDVTQKTPTSTSSESSNIQTSTP
jgi:hypothetical protein